MKYKFYTGFLLLIMLSFNSCYVSKSNISILKNVNKDFIKLNKNDSIYYCRYEVSNEMYKEFLKEIEKIDHELFTTCYVDSTKWQKEGLGNYNQPLVRNYFSHYAYKDFPVVNVSLFGAKQYCIWLTKKVQKQNSNISFRLPTDNEFKSLMNTVEIKVESDNPIDYQTFQFNLGFKGHYSIDGSTYTTIAYEAKNQFKLDAEKYIQNKYKMYHIIGNVEEILENGKSAGGSWFSFPSQVTRVNNHDLPDPRVGFRIIMVKK